MNPDDRAVLGIAASPHSSGNTATAVRAVLRGAEEAGLSATFRCLSDFNIKPLVAASGKPLGVGDPVDDMVSFYPLLESMAGIVFGTPIYFDHVSARAKIFIDRLISYSSGDRKGKLAGGLPAVVVIAYEWDKPDAYDDVGEWIKGRLEHYFHMKVLNVLSIGGTSNAPVECRKGLIRRAHDAGREMARFVSNRS